jgi:hypothetical protein
VVAFEYYLFNKKKKHPRETKREKQLWEKTDKSLFCMIMLLKNNTRINKTKPMKLL